MFRLFSRLSTLASRLLALVILPAQLPGDVVGMLESLGDAPLATVRSWSGATVRRLLRQLLGNQKLTLDDDPALRRLLAKRRRYLQSALQGQQGQQGWAHFPVHTEDGLELDALLLEPPQQAASADATGAQSHAAPRFIIFIGGNFQSYEDWLWYFDLYARQVRRE